MRQRWLANTPRGLISLPIWLTGSRSTLTSNVIKWLNREIASCPIVIPAVVIKLL